MFIAILLLTSVGIIWTLDHIWTMQPNSKDIERPT